jgi:hypothetical protein
MYKLKLERRIREEIDNEKFCLLIDEAHDEFTRGTYDSSC